MKKHLLSTSAIALGVAAAAPASAAEWNLDWGGFMSQHVAFTDTDVDGVAGDFDGVDSFNNSEIHFTPSITLDNGITFGVNVQLEGTANGGAFIDETFMTISGDQLGRIVIGNENSAGYLSMVAAPEVTSLFINSPSTSGFLPFTATVGSIPFRDAQHSAYTEVAGNNDVPRISYYTPSFNGLVIGVSYASTSANNAGNNFSNDRDALGTVSDIFDIGVNYSGSFGGTDINFGARYGTADSNLPGVQDAETWGVGASFSFAGFTVGGSYAENDNGGPGGVGGVGTGFDSDGWSFGVSYDLPGPWSVEALTYQGDQDSAVGGTDDYEAYRIGASRDLGPGVDWDLYVIYTEEDNNALGTEFDGTIVGTAINLSF